MTLIVLFGLPGTGKTYVGQVFKKYFGFYFYDGDADLTAEMKRAIKDRVVFTDRMRDVFFQQLTNSIARLEKNHKNLLVAQTFIKERYRIAFFKKFPEAKFILVETNDVLREQRLSKRKDYPLDMEYARKMVANFDRPKINHLIIVNNIEGVEDLKKQINDMLGDLSF